MPEKKQDMSDEIDLKDLLKKAWQGKKIILSCSAMLGCLGLLYTYLVTPVYQSEFKFSPVSLNVSQTLRQILISLKDQTVLVGKPGERYLQADLEKRFQDTINSLTQKRQFFKQENLSEKLYEDWAVLTPLEKEKAYQDFFISFKLKRADEKKAETISTFSLSLALHPEEVQALLHAYVESSQQRLMIAIANELEAEKLYESQKLGFDIDERLMEAKSNRLDRLVQLDELIKKAGLHAKKTRQERMVHLDEAILIAQATGIVTTKTVGPTAVINEVHNQGLPLYYLGSKQLLAEKNALAKRRFDADFSNTASLISEKKILEARTDDRPFVSQLRLLEAKKSQIDAVQIPKNLDLITVEQAATVAVKIKPRKAIIVILATSLGFILGCVLVFVKLAWRPKDTMIDVS